MSIPIAKYSLADHVIANFNNHPFEARVCGIDDDDGRVIYTLVDNDGHFYARIPEHCLIHAPRPQDPPPGLQICRASYSREELQDKLTDWLVKEYGSPIEMTDDEEKDRWHTRCGLIYHFIYDHFPSATLAQGS